MKLTKGQILDLESIKYFIPRCMQDIKITDDDISMFLENSERGLHKEKIDGTRRTMDGFHALLEGKKWRGIHIHEMYEPGVLEGTVPYYVLLGGEDKKELMPRTVVDFLKKEMFQGIDAELIERCYQEILYQYLPWYRKLWEFIKD